MNWKSFAFIGLIALFCSCGKRPAEVPLVYYHSFPKDTIVTLREIPREPSFIPLDILRGGRRVLVYSHYREGEGPAYFVYKYPEMTLLTGFGDKSEFRSLWRLDENRFGQVRGDSVFTYRFVEGDSLKQESASFFGGGKARYLSVAPLSNHLYAYSNSYERPGMGEYFIRDIKRNSVASVGRFLGDAAGFKSVYELKSAYASSVEVSPDRKHTLVYYYRVRRFRIYTAEGVLLHDVFLDCSSCAKVVDANRRRWRYCIQGAYVTDKYIYLMANGENSDGNDMAPCELLVTEWNGKPVARYRLNQHISSFFIDEATGRFYGINAADNQNFYSFSLL